MKRVFRILGYVLAALLLIAGGAVTYLYARKPAMAPASSLKIDRTPERLARGEYLYRWPIAMAAIRSATSARFGGPVTPGGRGVGTVFPASMRLPGWWRAPNLTPEPETGIGAWTDGEKMRAIREGIDQRWPRHCSR